MNKVILFMVVAAVMAGCHKKHKKYDPIKNVTEASKEKDLQGKTFLSECWLKPGDLIVSGLMTEGKAVVKAERVAYSFNGAQVKRETQYFLNADCSGESVFQFNESGTMKIDKGHKSNDGGYHIDLQFDELKGLPNTDTGVAAANSVKLCGITNWVKGEQKDVAPQSADITCYSTKVPRKIFTVYRFDAGNLYFGARTFGSERPATLDMTHKYTSK